MQEGSIKYSFTEGRDLFAY